MVVLGHQVEPLVIGVEQHEVSALVSTGTSLGTPASSRNRDHEIAVFLVNRSDNSASSSSRFSAR